MFILNKFSTIFNIFDILVKKKEEVIRPLTYSSTKVFSSTNHLINKLTIITTNLSCETLRETFILIIYTHHSHTYPIVKIC